MRALRAVSRLDPRRLPHLVLAAVLFLSVPAAPARAVQESGSQFSALEHAGARLVRSHQDRLKSARLALHPLTLDMVKNAVLERNLDIKVSALARDQAGLQEIERDAVFDSVLGLVVNLHPQGRLFPHGGDRPHPQAGHGLRGHGGEIPATGPEL